MNLAVLVWISICLGQTEADRQTSAGCSFIVSNVPGCSETVQGVNSPSTPICSLQGGLQAVIAAKSGGCSAIEVRLAPRSQHLLNTTLLMGASSSGMNKDAAVTWRMDPTLPGPAQSSNIFPAKRLALDTNNNAIISGKVPGLAAAASHWVVSADPRIPKRSQGKVFELDAVAAGLQLPLEASAVTSNDDHMELFVAGSRMPLARWPNYDPNNATLSYARLGRVSGTNSTTVGWGELAGTRPATWTTTPLSQMRLHGYFHIGWADAITPIVDLSTANRSFTMAEPLHYWPPIEGQWYYAFNLVEELDAPGEWWFDPNSSKIFFIPPQNLTTDWRQQVDLSSTIDLVSVNAASFIRFEGISFTTARGAAFIAGTDALGIEILNCTFQAGAGNAIILESSDIVNGSAPLTPGHTISGGSISDMGRGGIVLNGGARVSLTPSNCSITNMIIADYGQWLYTYQFGIRIDGVGVYVSNVDISGSRHEAISMPGNDHIVEFSRFHHLVLEAHDAAAIHQGRDWTYRGRIIRFNMFDHIGRYAYYPGPDRSLPCNSPPTSCIRAGIYMDDHEGGFEVNGNIFAGVEVAGIFAHNGRDNGPPEGGIDNNLFVRGGLGIRLSGVQECESAYNSTLYERLAAMPFQSELWASRYPLLAKILSHKPCQPEGNAFGLKAPNAAVQVGPLTPWEAEKLWLANYSHALGGGWLSLPLYGTPSQTLPTSMFVVAPEWNGTDVGFANPGDPLETLNFTLSGDSPLWQMNWLQIPQWLIGPWKRGVLPTE